MYVPPTPPRAGPYSRHLTHAVRRAGRKLAQLGPEFFEQSRGMFVEACKVPGLRLNPLLLAHIVLIELRIGRHSRQRNDEKTHGVSIRIREAFTSLVACDPYLVDLTRLPTQSCSTCTSSCVTVGLPGA